MLNIDSAVKFLPMAPLGHEPLHAAERKEGTKLEAHACPKVTKLKYCFCIPKLARLKFI